MPEHFRCIQCLDLKLHDIEVCLLLMVCLHIRHVYIGGPGFSSISPPSSSSLDTQGDRCPPAEKTAAPEGGTLGEYNWYGLQLLSSSVLLLSSLEVGSRKTKSMALLSSPPLEGHNTRDIYRYHLPHGDTNYGITDEFKFEPICRSLR